MTTNSDSFRHGPMRFWAGFDLVMTGLLALPFTAALFVQTLYLINGVLGGSDTPPAFDAIHWLFVCFTGGLGVLWAIVRLVRPDAFLSRCDAVARLWMSGLLLYFIFAKQAPIALLLFVGSELAGSIHQWWVLKRS